MPRSNKKKPDKKRIFIFCEGENGKSEFQYLEDLVSDKGFEPWLKIEMVPSDKNTPKELVIEAKRKINDLEWEKRKKKNNDKNNDEIWVVFDKDHYTKHRESFELAESYGISIAYTSICFEYWILLHFDYITTSFESCNDCVDKVKEHIKNYKKSHPNLYNDTREELNNAMMNAKRLREKFHHFIPSGSSKKPYHYDPWTDIDLLIESIESAGNQ